MKPVIWDLRLGDCLDPATGLASLADKGVDHVITDPPYESEAHTNGRRVTREVSSDTYARRVSVESIGFDPITDQQRAAAGEEMARISRRWILAFCQVEAAMKWRDAMVAGGARYRRTCVWVKPDGMPQYSGDRPGMGYESIVACHARGKSTWNGGGAHGVFVVNKGGDERTGHQTQKPIALMERLIFLFTDPGDTVVDPFAGSGTTGVAAIRLGRSFIGWERDAETHAKATERLRTTAGLPPAYFEKAQGRLFR